MMRRTIRTISFNHIKVQVCADAEGMFRQIIHVKAWRTYPFIGDILELDFTVQRKDFSAVIREMEGFCPGQKCFTRELIRALRDAAQYHGWYRRPLF